MTAAVRPRRLTGRAVLVMLLSFFGVVAAVNAAFVTLAIRSFSGVSAEGAYQRGLAWNRELAEAAAQGARGWSVRVDAVRMGGDAVRIEAGFADRAGQPLDGLEVRAALRRPASQGQDVAAALLPSDPGRYRADVALSLRGQWELRLDAAAPDGAVHVLEKRLWLP